MTIKHVLEGTRKSMKPNSQCRFADLIGMDRASVSKILNGKVIDVRISVLDSINRRSGISFDQLMAWYRQP